MALSIKDEETDRLVRRYARAKGVSYTTAIRMAVTEALRRSGEPVTDPDAEQRLTVYRSVVNEVRQAYAALPTLDMRDPDAILYDKNGLPK
ncbi:type II toxin-antitoxin system VapB family antitoxin [Sphingomonas sp. HT-1]|uniref:type II toxin-antitoxin system VapB family antitoxin n=1 Tax=unclassified Sphingomonas TaxID=196159 RepID=UPI000317974D|nr:MULTISPECIES: type II toxin-antitoxin system VapB family antitoxin [unclassified Sphingomonas]KTF67231.1 hypothetical protein ATB93_18500 [Sphingomonas sp. WG]